MNQFQSMAIGVGDIEVTVPDTAGGDFVRDFDTAGGEVVAHGIDVVSFDGDVGEAVGVGLAFGKELDILAVINFDEGEGEGAVGVLEVEGFGVTEEILVKGSCLVDVGDVEGDMGDAGDAGTFRGLAQRQSSEQYGNKR